VNDFYALDRGWRLRGSHGRGRGRRCSESRLIDSSRRRSLCSGRLRWNG
jgi:hypothetical protein